MVKNSSIQINSIRMKKSTYSQNNATWTGGWTIVYDYNGNQPLQTLVSADPHAADADGDFIPDDRERVYGYNPNLAEELNILGLESTVSSGYVAPSGTVAYTATVKNELDNRVVNGLLQAEFPVDQVQSNVGLGSIYPQMSVTTNGEVTAPAIAHTEVTSLTVRAGAMIDVSAVNQIFVLNFNEESGTTFFDATSARHDFTCTSGVNCPVPNAGTAAFSGIAITTPHHNNFNQDAFSLVARVKPTATNKPGTDMLYEDSGDFQVGLETGQIVVFIDGANGYYKFSESTLDLNQWATIVVTYGPNNQNGNDLKIYINGRLDSSFNAPDINPTNDVIKIGNALHAEMDEISLYNYALTEEEIANNADNLTFYADFEQDGCGNYIDLISQEKLNCNATLMPSGIAGQGGFNIWSNTRSRPFAGDDNSFSLSIWYETGSQPFAPTSLSYVPSAVNLINAGPHIRFYPDVISFNGGENHFDYNHMDMEVNLSGCMDGYGPVMVIKDAISHDSLSQRSWQHLVLTYGGVNGANNLNLYEDGRLLRTVTCENPIGYQTINYLNAGDGWLGPIDEVRLYSKALSAAEVDHLYQETSRSIELNFDEPPGQARFANDSVSARSLGGASCANNHTCPESGIPGRIHQALEFDSTQGDYVTLASNPTELDLKEDSFTVMAWVKGDSFSNGTHTILGTDSTQGLQLSVHNGQPYMGFSGSSDGLASPISLNSDKWHHITWRYIHQVGDFNSIFVGEQAIFIDGTHVISATGKAPFIGTDALLVGRSAGGNNFNGLIDQLIIVQEPLSDGAIQAIANEAPLLNLHLDEDLNTTSFVDDSPYQNTATCTGNACPAAGTKGQLREAPLFDAHDDMLTVDGSGELNLGTYTVGLWVKPTRQSTGTQSLMTKQGHTGDTTFALTILPNSMHVGFKVNPMWWSGYCTALDNRPEVSNTALRENTWNHVMMSYDGHQAVLYINGAEQGTRVYISSNWSGKPACRIDDPVLIGKNFAGHLDEVVIYDQVLSPLEIKALYDYQNTWYDTKNQHRVVIDADAPIVSVDAADNYINLPTMIPIFASDPSLLVETVEVTITAPDNSQTSTTYSGNGNGDWVVAFTPSGGGAYIIEAVATDSVGNSNTASKTVYVDDTPPTATLDSSLSGSVMHTTDDSVALFGTLSDPGTPATGVVSNTVSVDVQDWQNVSVQGFQTAVSDGSSWSAGLSFC